MTTTEQKTSRVLAGRVTSNKMQKSLTVLVERHERHPLYGKYIKKSTKYHVHDEAEVAKEGDWVEITQCRPISKTKKWNLVRVVDATQTA
jgi:small subunit ribosomal protein S17